ncbi:hypothetical protein J6590_097033 [Homalodisca vitripennis]|nr:hypothetical protein J6590_097033 [Homalodisca vitripennis]
MLSDLSSGMWSDLSREIQKKSGRRSKKPLCIVSTLEKQLNFLNDATWGITQRYTSECAMIRLVAQVSTCTNVWGCCLVAKKGGQGGGSWSKCAGRSSKLLLQPHPLEHCHSSYGQEECLCRRDFGWPRAAAGGTAELASRFREKLWRCYRIRCQKYFPSTNPPGLSYFLGNKREIYLLHQRRLVY